ncbi:MAG: HAMP domain-containing sensor histidine kinase [Eubacteriales bacterium]|nr:HAMP domain-containing sensor histidine kinase [Eubacteriales bacterium]
MKLWKKTVCLMLLTLLVCLGIVGGITLFITARRSISNNGETYGRQMQSAAMLLEQFWDEGKYNRMTEVGKKSYLNFQFRQCCGQGFALVKGDKVEENLTGYDIIDLSALDINHPARYYDYRIQKLSKKILMLQKTVVGKPEGYTLLSVRDVTGVYREIGRLAVWYFGVCTIIFIIAGTFIYRMMEKSMRAMEELQEVAEKQELLLGALSHEMKTPLTSIIGYSDSLLHVKLTGEQRIRALEHINREGRRMEALTGKMLQMMGMYQNDAVLIQQYSSGELIKRVEDLECERARERGIILMTCCEDFFMDMDIELMVSLLLNLIDNAMRASKEGDKVIVRAVCRDKVNVLEVEDFGRGIPENELMRVTEAFYMVDKSRSRREGGAGLGLALCRRIAELHGGEIEIKSQVGKGTTVTVRF